MIAVAAMSYVLLRASGFPLFAFQAVPDQPLRFEVASIRVHSPSGNRVDLVRRRDPPGLPNASNRRFADNWTTVKVLILRAYDLKPHEVLGLPGWASAEWGLPGEYYDVEAIAPMEDPTRPQMQAMLQALLAERFQLRAHREMRELEVYELKVAKGGAKFKAIAGEAAPTTPTVFSLIQSVSRFVDRPIIDRTGLAGYYEFPPSYGEIMRSRPETAGALSNLLRDHLGLELKPTRAETEVLVVDRVQRPSPN